MGGRGVQCVGVVGLGGGAEAGGKGGSGQQLLTMGGQGGVPGEGAPCRARWGGAGGGGVIKLMVRGGGQLLHDVDEEMDAGGSGGGLGAGFWEQAG